ncbi:DUF934 domain-containing protein [Entomobacter blattae]|uniref:DUF934 domain-containing protein n=1 Tax=Entomobacter blattae TaxID=2762277 RepID=A0A7H1NTW1_9PROT|nr:DUF934 domain-containing protein [Entomobacter blattae]QNT79221.1 hypothetical protein JGUZn3_20160 [Entomobacter blattae]
MLQLEHGIPVDEKWHIVEDDAPLPENDRILVTPERLTPELLSRNSGKVGVYISPDTDVKVLEPFLEHLPVIALNIPNFKDGRAFTQARALKEHLRYNGKILLTGRTLPDHYDFMLRCGIDSVVISDDRDLPSWKAAYERYKIAYQKSILKEPHEWGMRRKISFRNPSDP